MCGTHERPRVAPSFGRRKRLAAGRVGFLAGAAAAGANLLIYARDRGSGAGRQSLCGHRCSAITEFQSVWVVMAAELIAGSVRDA